MNVTALAAPAASNWKRVGWVLLLLGALFAAGNAVMFMLVEQHGSPDIKGRFFATAIAGWENGIRDSSQAQSASHCCSSGWTRAGFMSWSPSPCSPAYT